MNLETNLTLPVDKGMELALEILKAGAIAKQWGKTQTLLHYGVIHHEIRGIVYYFSDEDIKRLNQIVNDFGMAMRTIVLREGPQSQTLYPLCYGENWTEKFKTMGQSVRQQFIAKELNKPVMWFRNRLSNPAASTYHKFSADDIEQINALLRQAADTLSTITFITDKQ